MVAKPLLFVSSTSAMHEERAALITALREQFEVYAYEHDRASRKSPKERCRQAIEDSDVFVAVLGSDWGSAFPNDSRGRSIVEWEIDTALSFPNKEIMTFVKEGADCDEVDERQRRLIQRLTGFKTGLWSKSFSHTADLVSSLRKSLLKWLVEFWGSGRDDDGYAAQVRRSEVRISIQLNKTLWMPSAAIAVLASVLVNLPPEAVADITAGFLSDLLEPVVGLPASARLAVCALSETVVLMCFMLFRAAAGERNGTEWVPG